MGEFVRRTWLPAVLFAAPAFWYERANGPLAPFPYGAVTLYVLAVVPVVWWLLAAAREPMSAARAAGAGAACGGVLILIPAVVIAISAVVNPGDGTGELASVFGFVVLAGEAAILVLLGVAIGLVTVFLNRESQGPRPS
ncbi:MAG TPA: hypothetical protein VFQ05_04010 [Candidatus Eisenbacteria bacterium]|nr:hypothetical protein [Candidatus Eisenbacteria bacterium]